MAGIEVDLLVARLNLASIPQDLDLEDDSLLVDIDTKSRIRFPV